jgi:hypothetical protein
MWWVSFSPPCHTQGLAWALVPQSHILVYGRAWSQSVSGKVFWFDRKTRGKCGSDGMAPFVFLGHLSMVGEDKTGKESGRNGGLWFMPVILATQEAEVRSQPWANSLWDPILKKKSQCVDPEFKPQYQKRKKRRRKEMDVCVDLCVLTFGHAAYYSIIDKCNTRGNKQKVRVLRHSATELHPRES